jgi:hypothetical protein
MAARMDRRGGIHRPITSGSARPEVAASAAEIDAMQRCRHAAMRTARANERAGTSRLLAMLWERSRPPRLEVIPLQAGTPAAAMRRLPPSSINPPAPPAGPTRPAAPLPADRDQSTQAASATPSTHSSRSSAAPTSPAHRSTRSATPLPATTCPATAGPYQATRPARLIEREPVAGRHSLPWIAGPQHAGAATRNRRTR